MLDSGRDEEDRSHEYEKRNLQYLKETKVRNENPLLVTSAVAFGSNDWDGFEHDIEENCVLDESYKQKEILELKGDSIENFTRVKELGQLANSQDIIVTTLSDQSPEAPTSCPVETFHPEEGGQLILKPRTLCAVDDSAEHELNCVQCKEVSASVVNTLSCPLSDGRPDQVSFIGTEPYNIKEMGLED